MGIQTRVKDFLKSQNSLLWLEYSLVALAVMLPMLRSGYILTLDLVFTPKIRLPTSVDNNLFFVFLHYLNYFLPSQSIEKAILFSILVLSGVGMHRLVETHSYWPRYFAGLLYVFSPFTYSRFMVGQILVLLGYALLPFFLKALFVFLDNPTRKNMLTLVGLVLVISIISLHEIFFLILLAAVTLGLAIWQYRLAANHLTKIFKYGTLGLAITLLASSYWLIPLLRGSTPTAQLLQTFDTRHFIGFQTSTDPRFGVLFNTASLYGFWGDRGGRYLLPKAVVPAWYLLFGLIFLLVLTGVLPSWRRNKQITLTLVFVGLVSWVLAVGEAFPPFAVFYQFLVKYVPFFTGFRDSQKFVSLIVLVYAYFGSFGMDSLLKKVSALKGIAGRVGQLLPGLLLTLPLLYTPTMLWGFANQLKPAQYPPDWYALNRTFNADKTDFKILFFPWHQYLGFRFSGRVIANPAADFFDKPTIQGDNIEFGEISRQVQNPTSQYIEDQILRKHYEITNAGQRLAGLGIKYIVVAKDADFKNYAFLDRQLDLRQIGETEDLKVYLNTKFALEVRNED